jgi:hypothetical protein
MKRFAAWAAASMMAIAAGLPGAGVAAEKNAAGALGALSGMTVPNAELGKQQARGVDLKLNGLAVTGGATNGNAVIGNSLTGFTRNDNSINNNTGITTVFQNTGNNALFQSSIAINITLH